MNMDVISERIKKRRVVFVSTFDDAPPEARLEMILKLYWHNAFDTAQGFFGSIDANVPVGVHRKFVRSEQQLAMDELIGAARDEVNQLRGLPEVSVHDLHGLVAVTVGRTMSLANRLRAAKRLPKRQPKATVET
jgi:hypothetical protein